MMASKYDIMWLFSRLSFLGKRGLFLQFQPILSACHAFLTALQSDSVFYFLSVIFTALSVVLLTGSCASLQVAWVLTDTNSAFIIPGL